MNLLKSKSFVFALAFVALATLFSSCNDETGSIGINAMPNSDQPSTSQAVYQAFSSSLKVDSLIANTSECYLGRVTDPETGATTTCNYLAQFYSLENYELPEISTMKKENGKPVADSIDLRLYIYTYYGDSLNSMKIGVYELDSANSMAESVSYYTNMDATQYLNKRADAISKTTTFAVTDLETSDSMRYSSSYSKNIHIKLPASVGTKFLNKYYEHPEYFKNSYSFTHHVMPGFYFKVLSGNGTIVDIDVSTLNIYFSYTVNDSTYTGIQRVAATEEVLQNNAIENKGLSNLLTDDDCTYLKTPAGIFTEVTLPIDSIYENHQKDSVNSAKIVFKRENNDVITKYSLSTASQLLLLPKSDLYTFFSNHDLPDSKTSFITTFSSTYNSYSYTNIAALVSTMKNTRDNGAGVTSSDPEATRKSKIAAWEAENPDWNKVVLVPVSTVAGTSSYTKVYHQFNLTSTKLVGGSQNPIDMSVVYSHFNN